MKIPTSTIANSRNREQMVSGISLVGPMESHEHSKAETLLAEVREMG